MTFREIARSLPLEERLAFYARLLYGGCVSQNRIRAWEASPAADPVPEDAS